MKPLPNLDCVSIVCKNVFCSNCNTLIQGMTLKHISHLSSRNMNMIFTIVVVMGVMYSVVIWLIFMADL